MPKYRNTNDRYGEPGPFEAESKQALVAGMADCFKRWAHESAEQSEGPICDYDKFIADQIGFMQEEFLESLEEV
jgi:hypothetical protein